MPKILVIEDDVTISKGLVQALSKEGYDVATASDGAEGLFAAQTQTPDLVILDIMMPEMNGFEVITELRRRGDSVAVIVLSARGDKPDKIRGLDLGADDYVAKPFDLDELLARVRRLLSRQMASVSQFGDNSYDWSKRLLSQNDSPIDLTSKELKLLEFFLKRVGQLISRDQILDAVWGSGYDGTDRTVDNLVVQLRKKVGTKFIRTERGLGYRFATNL